MKKPFLKKRMFVAIAALLFVSSFAVFLYPVYASWRTANTQAEILAQFEEDTAALYETEIEAHFIRAEEINHRLSLLEPEEPFDIGFRARLPEDYAEILNVGDIMGHLEIPVINVNLPIFHTTHPDVLDIGVGHLEGTSFPVGGEGTHSALTAHSALPTARLFSDLEGNVDIGDIFFITVLDRVLAYEVDQILIVYPHEIEHLRVVPGEDLVTLITCTPPAINTHRLLVRGRRIPYYGMGDVYN